MLWLKLIKTNNKKISTTFLSILKLSRIKDLLKFNLIALILSKQT